MAKRGGLGKGLDALLMSSSTPELVNQDSSDTKIFQIKLDKIKPGKFQPRRSFDEEDLQELANSIENSGIIQPIVVRKLKANNYEIIAGERRYRAAKLAGLEQIPTIIRDLSDQETLIISLIENIQRKDLNSIEEALGYKRLVDEFRLTHEDLARVSGRSRSHISNILRLLNLHKTVQEMVMCGQLDMGHARALLPLGLSEQVNLANIAIDEDLTTSEVERRVAMLLHKKDNIKVKKSHPSSDPDISRLETKLADKFGMMVSIKHGRTGRGKIILNYNTLDELDTLLGML